MTHVPHTALPIRKVERPRSANGDLARIPEYYGCNVFDLKAMAKKLTAGDVKILTKVMKYGGKIDTDLAERVASAAREWAVEKGATHYCHWFQPQTGATAEKHDAFFWFDRDGNPIERFTGRELLQSEPDASSFPSGGKRATFEARGYTGWDPSSPMFVMETENGLTLYIPSVFISYHGEALDFKTPLLRANEVIGAEAVKTLHLLGHKDVTNVTITVGPEQEFFLVQSAHAKTRVDLQLSGRALLGRKPPKGQELEDHYFAHIPSRVHAFLNELEIELYKLGVPVKTRHNEVAPGQFEVAPIFEGANVANDHNQLLMKIMPTVAVRHGYDVLFHEKPFAGVNGSGKHVNWSLTDSTGRNLLDPGHNPKENIIFLTVVAGVLQGILDNADLLRAAIATAGNDHRLGANEAPPAIISVFMGDALDRILTAIEKGTTEHISAEKAMIDMGVSHLQELLKDNTDRNRTSPFAFTGNKFEFRAVGSSANIGFPTAILNVAVWGGLKKLNEKLAAKAKNGVISPEDTLHILRDVFVGTNKIRFEGNGYSQEWRDEAARRGLSNFPNTPTALESFRHKEKVKVLIESGVFNAEDIEARYAVQVERYIKQRLIELNCLVDMVQTGVLPVGLAHLQSLVALSRECKEMGINAPAQRMAIDFGNRLNSLEGALAALKTELERFHTEDPFDHHHLHRTASLIADKLIPRAEALRLASDDLEAFVPSDKWPFAKTVELLFDIE